MLDGKTNPVGVATRSQSAAMQRPNKRRAESKIEEASIALNHTPASQLPRSIAKRATRRTEIDRLTPLFQCTRDEAFEIGTDYRTLEIGKMIQSLPSEQLEKIQAAKEAIVDASEEDSFEELEDVSSRSQLVASQCANLYSICSKAQRRQSKFTEAVKTFAHQLALELPEPDDETSEEESVEIDAKFTEMAATSVKSMGIDLTDEQMHELALKLQKASNTSEVETDQEDVSDLEESIMAVLGHLLYVASFDLELAAHCVAGKNVEEGSIALEKAAREKLSQVRKELDTVHQKFVDSQLQNSERAYFHHMSLKMAECLLLENGALNIGLFDSVCDLLIPKDFNSTIAIEQLKAILRELKYNPEYWVQIVELQIPESSHLPSNQMVQAALGLDPQEKITARHVQITVLSAILGHYRQANAGTCFATAWLIKTLHNNLKMAIDDFGDMVEFGKVQRLLSKENREFPITAKATNEGFDTLLTINRNGIIKDVKDYTSGLDPELLPTRLLKDVHLTEAPGVRAVCQALGLNVELAIEQVVTKWHGTPFTVGQLLEELATIRAAKHGASAGFKKDDYRTQANFTFAAQTRHPLHMGWDQVGAEMVDYFGSQYQFPRWTNDAIQSVLERLMKNESAENKRQLKKILAHMFLPMISRMRYVYDPLIEKSTGLFDDTKVFVIGDHYYGYFLWDSGLPRGYNHSTELHYNLKNKLSMFSLERFEGYAAPTEWTKIDSGAKFQAFICSVVDNALNFIQKETGEDLRDFGRHLKTKINHPSFIEKSIELLLGKGTGQKRQRKALKRNPETVNMKPWEYNMGGWPDDVVKSYYSFGEYPVKDRSYSGSQRTVCAWIINYLRQQPEEVQEKFEEPHFKTQICSPVHAFLLEPGNASLQQAVTSDLKPIDYVAKKCEEPGIAVANQKISLASRQVLIDVIATNEWVKPVNAKHDLDRQELTDISKRHFDELFNKMSNWNKLDFEAFNEQLIKVVCTSRAADPRIGKRNVFWEKSFKKAFANRCKNAQFPRDAKKLIDFARNRQDTSQLTKESSEQFRKAAEQLPAGLSYHEFREKLLKLAGEIYTTQTGIKASGWLKGLSPYIDTKLFQQLPKQLQKKMINSMIWGMDSNWTTGIHNIYLGFMINPATAKLELVCYTPDTQFIRFREQKGWFKQSRWSRWNLPGVYRAFSDRPLFNKDVLF